MLAYKVLGRVSRTRNCDEVRLQLIEGLFEASEGAGLSRGQSSGFWDHSVAMLRTPRSVSIRLCSRALCSNVWCLQHHLQRHDRFCLDEGRQNWE